MMETEAASSTVVGRYVLHAPIARGGMATIHLARLLGAEGFSRTVAAKRLHPQFTEDGEFLKMFLDEARIASKVHHPNVVPVLDVVQSGSEVILVQEYVHGVPFDKLLRSVSQQKKLLPINVVVSIVAGMLAGLHAAHTATDELGKPLEIVHRDVSPQNVLIGVDGTARLLDFGVAKASMNNHVTRVGVFKGKLAYSSPEALQGVITRSADIYATGVLLWEALVGRRLYAGMVEPEMIAAVLASAPPKLTDVVTKSSVPSDRYRLLQKLEPIVARSLAFAKEDRFATAADMQEALMAATPLAPPTDVSKWVRLIGKDFLEGREKVIASEETSYRRQKTAEPVILRDESIVRSTSIVGSQPGATTASLRASIISLPPPRGRSQWAIVGALMMIGGLLAGIFVLLWRSPVDAASFANASAASPEVVTATLVAAAPVQAAPSPPPVPVAAPPPSADSGAAPPARPTPVWRPRAVAPTSPRATEAPAAAPTPTPTTDCNPPFFFDGKKKIFKPGCL